MKFAIPLDFIIKYSSGIRENSQRSFKCNSLILTGLMLGLEILFNQMITRIYESLKHINFCQGIVVCDLRNQARAKENYLREFETEERSTNFNKLSRSQLCYQRKDFKNFDKNYRKIN
ncbi:CLUMA_CG007032, isoform A [Clunio marinus]|uniref:CLUMA_CG007032, isoform A n=1 Tax=Clunio marinus TaxID=568069 RepID=A0A1J1HZG7_9DIPT|nr:CLUMA_CG007032, isoform A [Clunio marinus]